MKTRRFLIRVTRSRSLIWISAPLAMSLIVWMGYNKLINGTIYPNTYLAKRDPTFGLFPLENISNVFHWGVSFWQPWLSGWILPFTIIIYLFAVLFVARKGRWTYLSLAIFPLLMIVAVGKASSFNEEPFLFWARRYVDPAAPVIVLTLTLGAWGAVNVGRSFIHARVKTYKSRLLAISPLVGLIAVVSIVSIDGSIDIWKKLHHDYSWNSRNIADEDVAAGKWVNEHLPADYTVFIADAGAIRYFGNRFTHDSLGLNTHEVVGRTQVDQVITEKPDALAIWVVPEFDNLPIAEKQVVFTTPRNTILGGGPVGVYTLDWERDDFADASQIRLVQYAGEVIDELNLVDRDSEQAHDYFLSFVAYAPNAIFDLDGAIVEERGLLHRGPGEVVERLTVAAVRGKPLTLVLRHVTNVQPDFVEPDVYVDGIFAGTLPLEEATEVPQETAFTIPADLVTSDRVEIEVRWNIKTTEFRWWAIVGAE